jgi:pimeloyl-ACP methyl ester carboxylesterase
MTSFVLIPGAGGAAWYWHRVIPLLRDAGHDAVAVDLPADDETAGLPEYARVAAAQAGGYSTDFDLDVYFLHDVPPDVAAAGEPYQRPEAAAAFRSGCDFAAWPAIPIRVVAGAGDRFFPADFQRRVAGERLGIEADVLPGGHLIALSQPAALAAYLLST